MLHCDWQRAVQGGALRRVFERRGGGGGALPPRRCLGTSEGTESSSERASVSGLGGGGGGSGGGGSDDIEFELLQQAEALYAIWDCARLPDTNQWPLHMFLASRDGRRLDANERATLRG